MCCLLILSRRMMRSVLFEGWLLLLIQVRAFVHQKPPNTRSIPLRSAVKDGNADNSDLVSSSSSSSSSCRIVLFGLGDLRVDDHGGLHQALQHSNDKILPICVLDDKSLQCFPGSVAHTADTAQCLHHAIKDLQEELHSKCSLSLQIMAEEQSLTVALEKVFSEMDDGEKIYLHACDLGAADNQLGYGPFSQLTALENLASNVEVVSWTQDLRKATWEKVEQLPNKFTEYETKCVAKTFATEPHEINKTPIATLASVVLKSCSTVLPTAQELKDRMTQLLSTKNPLLQQEGRVEAEKGTGLFMTHWGGLPANTVGCKAALDITTAYATTADQNDNLWVQHDQYPGNKVERNGRSLEHATMIWQLKGDGTFSNGNPKNWMAGESMTRFLAAPLQLGTISPRRIWSLSRIKRPDPFPLTSFLHPLERLVEAREWHRLLAAWNIATNAAYQGHAKEGISYRYWRYNGFLCRYAITPMLGSEKGKESILLVHGFGASGAQWNKAMKCLSEQQKENNCHLLSQGLAPDLLGFGESEKPAISYTGYLWDSQTADFVKECAIAVHGWERFVIGGNSIGGFTSMSAAASDMAEIDGPGKVTVSSSGAPGTNLCSGLVLMNSAGPIKSREEIEEDYQQSEAAFQADPKNKLAKSSIAQITALDALPTCKPPLRPVTRAFGNSLLLYLRPRIQSICKNLYPTNPNAVDSDLCEAIERDSLDPGAVNVMMAGAKLPLPRTSNELLQSDFKMGLTDGSSVSESVFDGPVLICQGVLDPLNDAKDRLERFGALRQGIAMDAIQAGHCPHDEVPELVAASILKWMVTKSRDQSSAVVEPSIVATSS